MRHQKNHLAIFLPALYGGGAEKTMLNLAEGIAAKGVKVDLVLAQAEGPFMNQIPDTVKLVDLGSGKRIPLFKTFTRLPALVHYLRREKPDAMLAALSQASFAALIAGRLTKYPDKLVLSVQNTLSKSAPSSRNPLMKITPQLAGFFFRWADAVIGVSQGVADDLVDEVGVPSDKVKVIYNPGITPELKSKAVAPLEHEWFQENSLPVILAVGSLTKQKDFGTLIRAFAKVRRERAARLLILGEGQERAYLEGLVEELGIGSDVSMPGFEENPYAYMARSELFVLSSRWEGLPTVLIEALYCCSAVVATDCPSGPREILRNGELGTLVQMADADALAAAILDALGRDIALNPGDSWQPYSLDAIVEQYVNALL